jgi:hypothetical protein
VGIIGAGRSGSGSEKLTVSARKSTATHYTTTPLVQDLREQALGLILNYKWARRVYRKLFKQDR